MISRRPKKVMKAKTHLLPSLLALSLFASVPALRAQPSTPPPPRPDREELRRQLENLTPEERRARIKELRDTFGGRAGGPADAAAAERRRAELRERYDDLLRKDADGTITPEEKKQLDRMEAVVKRFVERPLNPPAATPPPEGPPAERRPPAAGFPGEPPGRFLPNLERVLTDDQRTSLREALQDQRERRSEVEEKLREARKEVFQASLSRDFDEEALRQKALAVGKLEAELTVLRARAFAKIEPPLSERQREQLKNLPPLPSPLPAARLRPELRRDEPPPRGPRDQHDLPPPPGRTP